MGFYLRCAVAKVEDAMLAAGIEARAAALFPPFVRVRRFAEPFAGVIAGYDPVKTSETIVDNFADHGFTDEDAAVEAVEGAVWARMMELSLAFPSTPFAYVDVDCFGGTCRFDGFVVEAGVRTHEEPFSSDAHVRLFARLGVPDATWHFAPFTRGFMETGTPADEQRRPVTFHVRARWDEPLRLAAIRATMLPAPWRVTLVTEQTCIVVHADDFEASLNAFDDHVELRARSFADLTLTTTLAHELADDDVALELSDADGKPL